MQFWQLLRPGACRTPLPSSAEVSLQLQTSPRVQEQSGSLAAELLLPAVAAALLQTWYLCRPGKEKAQCHKYLPL